MGAHNPCAFCLAYCALPLPLSVSLPSSNFLSPLFVAKLLLQAQKKTFVLLHENSLRLLSLFSLYISQNEEENQNPSWVWVLFVLGSSFVTLLLCMLTTVAKRRRFGDVGSEEEPQPVFGRPRMGRPGPLQLDTSGLLRRQAGHPDPNRPPEPPRNSSS